MMMNTCIDYTSGVIWSEQEHKVSGPLKLEPGLIGRSLGHQAVDVSLDPSQPMPSHEIPHGEPVGAQALDGMSVETLPLPLRPCPGNSVGSLVICDPFAFFLPGLSISSASDPPALLQLCSYFAPGLS